MRKALLGFIFLVFSGWMAAQASNDCRQVGGTISTNFLNATTTFGSATGDLAGGIGVKVLSVTPNPNGILVFHNQHSWVTATGDTIFTQPADVTALPTGVAGFYAASYLNGVVVTGGTGRFHNAHGRLAGWGAVDTNKNEIVLRYEGKLCFGQGEDE
jgi:hypothetical protein